MPKTPFQRSFFAIFHVFLNGFHSLSHLPVSSNVISLLQPLCPDFRSRPNLNPNPNPSQYSESYPNHIPDPDPTVRSYITELPLMCVKQGIIGGKSNKIPNNTQCQNQVSTHRLYRCIFFGTMVFNDMSCCSKLLFILLIATK